MIQNTQKLENGNYLSTTIGGSGTSVEVNQNGDSIWEANYNLQIPDGLVYRAMRIPGIFPIAYSVTFPQMINDLYELNIGGEDLLVSVLNNGDYTQTFDVNFNIIDNDNFGNYEAELTISPIHHIQKSKTYILNIYSLNQLENNITTLTLNPDEDIILSFGGNILDNLNPNDVEFSLSAPYPNPFNPSVNFEVNVMDTQSIDIDIFDIYGNKIQDIYSGFLNYGLHNFSWNASNFSAGVYIIQCKSKNNILTEKVYLIK